MPNAPCAYNAECALCIRLMTAYTYNAECALYMQPNATYTYTYVVYNAPYTYVVYKYMRTPNAPDTYVATKCA